MKKKNSSNETQKITKPKIKSEDYALWVEVARTVIPFSSKKHPVNLTDIEKKDEIEQKSIDTKVHNTEKNNQQISQKPTIPPIVKIEKGLLKKITKDIGIIEARLDLHGMRQDQAHASLLNFLHSCYNRGAKLVLIITGKGGQKGDDDYNERGILRRQLPHWLESPSLRHFVLGYQTANIKHGGEGAFYIRLRNKNKKIDNQNGLDP